MNVVEKVNWEAFFRYLSKTSLSYIETMDLILKESGNEFLLLFETFSPISRGKLVRIISDNNSEMIFDYTVKNEQRILMYLMEMGKKRHPTLSSPWRVFMDHYFIYRGWQKGFTMKLQTVKVRRLQLINLQQKELQQHRNLEYLEYVFVDNININFQQRNYSETKSNNLFNGTIIISCTTPQSIDYSDLQIPNLTKLWLLKLVRMDENTKSILDKLIIDLDGIMARTFKFTSCFEKRIPMRSFNREHYKRHPTGLWAYNSSSYSDASCIFEMYEDFTSNVSITKFDVAILKLFLRYTFTKCLDFDGLESPSNIIPMMASWHLGKYAASLLFRTFYFFFAPYLLHRETQKRRSGNFNHSTIKVPTKVKYEKLLKIFYMISLRRLEIKNLIQTSCMDSTLKSIITRLIIWIQEVIDYQKTLNWSSGGVDEHIKHTVNLIAQIYSMNGSEDYKILPSFHIYMLLSMRIHCPEFLGKVFAGPLVSALSEEQDETLIGNVKSVFSNLSNKDLTLLEPLSLLTPRLLAQRPKKVKEKNGFGISGDDFVEAMKFAISYLSDRQNMFPSRPNAQIRKGETAYMSPSEWKRNHDIIIEEFLQKVNFWDEKSTPVLLSWKRFPEYMWRMYGRNET